MCPGSEENLRIPLVWKKKHQLEASLKKWFNGQMEKASEIASNIPDYPLFHCLVWITKSACWPPTNQHGIVRGKIIVHSFFIEKNPINPHINARPFGILFQGTNIHQVVHRPGHPHPGYARTPPRSVPRLRAAPGKASGEFHPSEFRSTSTKKKTETNKLRWSQMYQTWTTKIWGCP